MGNRKTRQIKAAAAVKRQLAHDEEKHNSYVVAAEGMSTEEKLSILEEKGRPELIDLFKDWKPRVSNRKKRGAPLDQRVSITITAQERLFLNKELESIKEVGEKITMAQFIRNRALGTVDINGWKDIAERAFEELDETFEKQVEYRQEKNDLLEQIENEEDEDLAAVYGMRMNELNAKLNKLVAQNEKRNNRLSGRMSMAEAETIKWRAQRLCISSSDYLRMMIFALEPDSTADSHMSLDAKRRFYISIVDVAKNGWGTPPEVYECSQCINYMDEIRRLREELEQIRRFV